MFLQNEFVKLELGLALMYLCEFSLIADNCSLGEGVCIFFVKFVKTSSIGSLKLNNAASEVCDVVSVSVHRLGNSIVVESCLQLVLNVRD